jgi:cell division protein DivIC
VQLPPTAAVSPQPGGEPTRPANNDPWYTALWHTIADAPHLPPAAGPPPGSPLPAPPLPGPSGTAPPAPTKPPGG